MQPAKSTVHTAPSAPATRAGETAATGPAAGSLPDTLIQACLQHPDYHLHGLNFRRGTGQALVLEQWRFLRVNRATFDLSAFLDNRIYAPRKAVVDVPAARLLQHWQENKKSQSAPVHFIFHTAFCCSTLLSRLLQAPGYTVALREPWALRALAEVQRSGHVPRRLGAGEWRQLLAVTVDLLAKTYQAREQVVIKPSNLCNGLVDDLMTARPQARAVWLTNSLRDFLVSVLKKQPDTQAKMRGLAAMMHGAPQVHTARGALSIAQLNSLQAAAVLWQVQQEQLQRGAARWSGRIRPLQAANLVARPGETCHEVSDFLGLALPPGYFSGTAFSAALHHHAKAPQLSYNAARRDDENRRIEAQHRSQLDAVVRWHEDYFGAVANGQASVA